LQAERGRTKGTSISVYHVTLLSNFAIAFDKYKRLYRKSAIPESTYPNEFYVLTREELLKGVNKAQRLRDKLAIPGDMLIALNASLPLDELKPNQRNGIGLIWSSPDLPVSKLYSVTATGELAEAISLEDAMAKSLALRESEFVSYADLKPRSLSFLPIAKGCQASCPFCFSDASASSEQDQIRLDWNRVREWVELAHRCGAERAVITGGGEPTLLRWADLIQLVRTCRARFEKIVLITNGVALSSMREAEAAARVRELHHAGLSVLAISRHHPSETINAQLMALETHTPALLRVCASNKNIQENLKTRLICVLQRGGIETADDIGNYAAWAAASGVEEVCFKELYVSTSLESVYYSHAANSWSARNQIPLSIVHSWASANGFVANWQLPWGAPVFSGTVDGKAIRVAAYTEPSLFWERSHGIARSWNIMADGSCLASLEDRRSAVPCDPRGEKQ
jgi:hypothetical protein